MKPPTFPTIALICSVAIAVPSIYLKDSAGLGFASGLATAAGTAYQYQQKGEDE